MLKDIDDAIDYFKIGLWIGVLTVSFPIKKLQIEWFIRKTNRRYNWQTIELFDFVFAFLNVLLFTIFEIKTSRLTAPEDFKFFPKGQTMSSNQIFFFDMEKSRTDKEFPLSMLMALISAFFIFRMALLLRLTKTFGPFITIIQAMLSTLGVFFILWANILFIYASAGFFIFGAQIADFATVFSALN
jgi:hypothetical protein